MSMQDPIADMLTRIRNANMRNHPKVDVPYSVHKEDILKTLKSTGYITNYSVSGEVKKTIHVVLKYVDDEPVIRILQRVSKTSRRVFRGFKELSENRFNSGLGSAIVSTSKGIMTDKDAIAAKVGGEVLFYISV